MSNLDLVKAASELFGAVSQELGGNIQHISNEGLQDLTTNELAQVTAKAEENQSLYDAQEYSRNRAEAYPSIQDQLDDIFHNGVDGWKKTILAVKDANPKT